MSAPPLSTRSSRNIFPAFPNHISGPQYPPNINPNLNLNLSGVGRLPGSVSFPLTQRIPSGKGSIEVLKRPKNQVDESEESESDINIKVLTKPLSKSKSVGQSSLTDSQKRLARPPVKEPQSDDEEGDKEY